MPSGEGLDRGAAGGPFGDACVLFDGSSPVLVRFPDAREVAYADDGYIKAKLSVALRVLAELKLVFKEDAGLELNVVKTSVLLKGVSQQAAFDAAQYIIQTNPTLTHLSLFRS